MKKHSTITVFQTTISRKEIIMNSNRNKNIFNVTANNNCKEQNMSRNSDLFSVTTNNKAVPMNRANETSESGFGTALGMVFLIGSILLLLGFAYIHWGSPKSIPIQLPGVQQEQSKTEKAYDTVALRQQINRLAMDYQDDCNRLLEQYLNLLESNVTTDFEKANGAIPGVVDELSGIGACTKLCYKAAKDKIKGSHDFEDAYMEVMNQPIIQPCLRANAVATEMLQTLNQRLMERHTQYAMDLATVCGDNRNQISAPDLERLQQCISTVAASSNKLQREKMFALVGVAFEAVFIRSTCRAIVKLFAKPAAKICSSLGIGGICAAADGPIPVGDIIAGAVAVGTLAWTACDVYDVTCVMPEKLKTELCAGLDETRNQLLEDSRSKARELVKTYQESGNTLKAELIKQI